MLRWQVQIKRHRKMVRCGEQRIAKFGITPTSRIVKGMPDAPACPALTETVRDHDVIQKRLHVAFLRREVKPGRRVNSANLLPQCTARMRIVKLQTLRRAVTQHDFHGLPAKEVFILVQTRPIIEITQNDQVFPSVQMAAHAIP